MGALAALASFSGCGAEPAGSGTAAPEATDEAALVAPCTGRPCGALCHPWPSPGFCNAWSQCVPAGTPLWCSVADGGLARDAGFPGDGGASGLDGSIVLGDGGATGLDGSIVLGDGGASGLDGSIVLGDGGATGLDGSVIRRDGGFAFDGGASADASAPNPDGGLGGPDGSIFVGDATPPDAFVFPDGSIFTGPG